MPFSPRSARRMTGSRSPITSGYLAFKARNEACASDSLRCEDTCTRYPPSVPGDPDDATWVAGGFTATAVRVWANRERGAFDAGTSGLLCATRPVAGGGGAGAAATYH